ncbi:MAG: carbamoyltransferase C-terminal domain-containing protein [Nitrososphaeria archaeon]
MATVIGFNWPLEHDHAVAVIVDGKLIFASEEERYTRHKHSIQEPPINALKQAFLYLKNNLGIKPNDIEAFAVNFDPKYLPWKIRYLLAQQNIFKLYDCYGILSYLSPRVKIPLHIFMGDYLIFAHSLVKHVIRSINEEIPSNLRIIPVYHHLTHAASAYYFSGFNSATVITVDGTGEFESTVIWQVKNNEFEKIISIPTSVGSIGSLYEAISAKIGYDFLEGPGKAMGLAPYGKSSHYYQKLKSFIKIQDSDDYPYYFSLDGSKPKVSKSKFYELYQKIADILYPQPKVPWNPRGELHPDAVNLAWSVQKVTEELILHLAKWAKDHTSEDRIALAGGVALNAKASMELYYSRIFNDIFIFPAANDAGGPIGAAAYVYEHVLGGKMKHGRLKHLYLGAEYDDEKVKKVIERSKFKAEYIGDDVNAVADLVAKGEIVTWYQGRAELGPRALGNRSIIADPTRKDYWRLVNDIKGREWWRPLAPSLLDEDKDVYFKDPVSHEFMILMFRYKDEEVCKRVPVTCHVDLTARPQTVTRDQNKTWYDLIKAFKDLKGEGLIMNTSFNLAGEPLVETPQDAIKSFSLGGFDAMYMQGWLIKKK